MLSFVSFDQVGAKPAEKISTMDKDIVEANKEAFSGAGIVESALKNILNKNNDMAIDSVTKLITKEYQTRREISDLENKLAKAKESLAKTTEKVEKVKAGDLSVLFEKQQENKKEE